MTADISPSTTKILECIPISVVKKMVSKCLPTVEICWEDFEQGKFYPSTISAVNRLSKEEAAEFYDVVRRINDVSKYRENGRFVYEEIASAGRLCDMHEDLGIAKDIAAMSAWVFCEMPELWARITKRISAAEVAGYRSVTKWYAKPRPSMSREEGEKCFCEMLKDYLKKVSQPLKHVHLDRDVGEMVTRYVIHFDPYPQKVPTFDKEDSDELAMCLGIEAERFQVTVFHEAQKLVIRCQFSNEQTDYIIKLFLDYILQAKRIARPQSSYNIGKFNTRSFDWDTSKDEDVVACRTCGIKFMLNHPDGLIEEIGRTRSRGDILEYLAGASEEFNQVVLPRTILEAMVEVTILSGRRPSSQQLGLDGSIIETRQQKSFVVKFTETGRSVLKCRNKSDRDKIECFLDHNGLFDQNHVVK